MKRGLKKRGRKEILALKKWYPVSKSLWIAKAKKSRPESPLLRTAKKRLYKNAGSFRVPKKA
jgi:hypothetical protein